MTYKVHLDSKNAIKTRLKINKNGAAQRYLQNEAYRFMDKYVPLKKRNLRKNVDLSNPKLIVYESPYAKYMFYGKKMVMPENGKSAFYSPSYGFWSIKGGKKVLTNIDLEYHTPGTGSYWHKKMMSAEGKKLQKKVEKFIREGGK